MLHTILRPVLLLIGAVIAVSVLLIVGLSASISAGDE